LRIDLNNNGKTYLIILNVFYFTIIFNYILKKADRFISYYGYKKFLLRPGKNLSIIYFIIIRKVITLSYFKIPEKNFIKIILLYLNRNLRRVLKKYANIFRNDLPNILLPPK